MFTVMKYPTPPYYEQLRERCTDIGFDMPSEMPVGQLLKVLIASKPGGNFLELGTGMGLSLSWMIAGMDGKSTLTTLDDDEKLIREVSKIIDDPRVSILHADGDQWIETKQAERFDLVFADTWPGKYRLLEETLAMLHPGGIYIVDDMLPQENWPEGHDRKAAALTEVLLAHDDLVSVSMNWSTGVLIGVKK